jgi:hypothetical protein
MRKWKVKGKREIGEGDCYTYISFSAFKINYICKPKFLYHRCKCVIMKGREGKHTALNQASGRDYLTKSLLLLTSHNSRKYISRTVC